MNAAATRRIVVVDAGMLSTVQDLGRGGYAALGVSPSGAADWFAARAANRLVGNHDNAALIECTMTGVTFDVCAHGWIAVTGADAPLRVAGSLRSTWRGHTVTPGDRVIVGSARAGLRSYVAFDGGVDVERVMGSRSTDVGAGFGGLRIANGASIALGDGGLRGADDPALAYGGRAIPELSSSAELRVMAGPDADRLGGDGIEALCARPYQASIRSTRQALRLEGDTIPLQRGADVISAGTSAGCVQVTGEGLPIVLLAEHQTTGGYAVPLCVITADLPRAGQMPPGGSVRFRLVAYPSAIEALADAASRLRDVERVPATGGLGADAHLARGFFEGA